MIAADRPVQRPPGAKLLVIDACGAITHASRAWLVEFLRPGDLVIANDAATLPASLQGVHEPSDGRIEVRLAGRRSLAPEGVHFLSIDPGDMDTPLHAAAIPDADPATLKRPEAAARDLADAIAAALPPRAGRPACPPADAVKEGVVP